MTERARWSWWSLVTVLGPMALCAWSFFVWSFGRSQDFGLSLTVFALSSLAWLMFVGPFVAIVFGLGMLGGRAMGFLRRLLLVVLLSVVAAELYWSAQELAFRYRHEGSTEPAFEQRWWPYRHHHISYDGEGNWSADC